MMANLNANQDINVLTNTNLDTKSAKVTPLVKTDNMVLNTPVEMKVKPSDIDVDQALSVVNKAAVFEQRSLTFTMDEDSGRSVVKVIDKNTDQVIRQIPTEELLKVSQDIKKLQEEMGQSLGLLVNSKV